MARTIKPVPRVLMVIASLAVLYFGGKAAYTSGWIPGLKPKQSVVPERSNLPTESPMQSAAAVPLAPIPSTAPSTIAGPVIVINGMAWNSQMSLMLALGGHETTRGSLMEKYGVKMRFERVDPYDQMGNNLIAFATDLEKGTAQPNRGAAFCMVMGDGAPAFLAGLNGTLGKLGSEYRAKVVYSTGRSLGEDKYMALPEVLRDPNAARGSFVAVVLRDGDWNIVVQWAADNNIPINTDEKTFDENAINFFNPADYVKAAEAYISGYSETRPEVANGKRTGRNLTKAINGVSTWTPADVTVATQKGGLVPIASTKDYVNQMPNVVIGIDKWCQQNSRLVEGMIAAIAEAGDQVKLYPQALARAAEVSNLNYHETGTNPEYWQRYFKGDYVVDRTGLRVHCGGSAAHNLADNLRLFGLDGGVNYYKITYETFGGYVVKYYPEVVPSIPPYDEIVDMRYVRAVAARTTMVTRAETPTFRPNDQILTQVGKRSWPINFETGSATFTSGAYRQLEEMFNGLAIGEALLVELHGHTDNVGNPDSNLILSQRRAEAVRGWLTQKGIDPNRLRVIPHGQNDPIAGTTDSASDRARNRRVEVVVGRTAA